MLGRWHQRVLTYLAIAVGGTLGCWARYAMTNLVQVVYGRDFPYATLSINLLGAFLMGFLFIETLERLDLPLVVEFCDKPSVAEAALRLLDGLVPAGHILTWRAQQHPTPVVASRAAAQGSISR
jgi:CrcB-like protein, Camphor Resistance (CrcB)